MKWFKSLKLSNRVFVSPDVGNVKRAQVYANMLGGEICIIDKRRKSGSETEAEHIIGDVEGKNVLMVDDMITTAGTVTEACKILRDNGVKDIYIAATHAVFAPPAMERLSQVRFHEAGGDRHDPDRHACRRDQGPAGGAERRRAARRSDPPHPPQRVGQRAVRGGRAEAERMRVIEVRCDFEIETADSAESDN